MTALDHLLAILGEEDPRPKLAGRRDEIAALLQAPPQWPRLDALVAIETGQLFEWDAASRLAALLPDDAVAVARIASRLGAPTALCDRLVTAVADDRLRIVSWLSPREMRRSIYQIGAQAFRDRVLLGWAASNRPAATPQWRVLLVYPDTWTAPAFPITDTEIRAAGVPLGPIFERVRREVEAWWIDLDFTDDKMAAVERLKAVAQGLVY
jgi:poly(A) polymerase